MLIISIVCLCVAFFYALSSTTSINSEIYELRGLISGLTSIIFFVLHQTNKKITSMQKDIDNLWEIAKEKGYQRPTEEKQTGNADLTEEEFTEEQAEEYFANLNNEE